MSAISVTRHRIDGISLLARSRLSRAFAYTFATLAGILVATRGDVNPSILILAPLSTFLIFLGIYILNDLFDLKVDSINAPTRPLVSRRVTREEAAMFVLVLSTSGAAIALYLGRLAFFISLFEIFLGIAYSIRPFNFKDKFIVKTLTVGAGGVSACFFGGASAGVINYDLIFSSAMSLIFLFSTSPLNDLGDYVGDKEAHRRTIPIVIGPKRTLKLSIAAAVAPLVCYLVMFQFLSFNSLSVIFLGLVAARAVQILVPLFRTTATFSEVRTRHKQMVYLYFLLQGGLMLGSLPI